MNAKIEKSKLELPEEYTFPQIELDKIKPALKPLKPLKPKSEIPQPKPFARHIVTRWKNLGHEHQHPAPDKSRWKIKRPHA